MEVVGREVKTMVVVQVIAGSQSDYYILDLGANKVMKTPFTSLVNEYGFGTTTLCSGSLLCNVGGHTHTRCLEEDALNSNHHIHLGASYLELEIPHLHSLLSGKQVGDGYYKWKALPCMQHYRISPACAFLGGALYVLGGSNESLGEVYIPSRGKWEPLDSSPSNFSWSRDSVSYPVISDEKNERLLVHIRNDSSLYAYYPFKEEWDLLIDNLRIWEATTTLADDVLYFHVNGNIYFLSAYDLSTKAWLKVEYSSNFHLEFCILEFQDMLYLGNGILCLAAFIPICDVPGPFSTKLVFAKFKVERISPTTVLVTPIGDQYFLFEGYLCAEHFMLL